MRLLPGPWLLVALSVATGACGPATPPAGTPPPPIVAAQPTVPAEPRDVAASAPAPRYDLAADEHRGGHTIERHVGRTDDQLRERLRREPNISAASTYDDLVVAEEVVARAFAESDYEVSRWQGRTGRRPNLVIERTETRAIGRWLRRGQRAPAPCDRAIVVLRWDERDRSSYVLTSYPECGR